MAIEKQTKKESGFLSKVDWIDFGIKVGTSACVAIATGYLGAAGQDLYQSRKARHLSKAEGSNVHLLEDRRSA